LRIENQQFERNGVTNADVLGGRTAVSEVASRPVFFSMVFQLEVDFDLRTVRSPRRAPEAAGHDYGAVHGGKSATRPSLEFAHPASAAGRRRSHEPIADNAVNPSTPTTSTSKASTIEEGTHGVGTATVR